jgi:hypothetical protein
VYFTYEELRRINVLSIFVFFVVPYRQGIDLAGFYGNWVLERKVWAGSQFDLNFWRGVEELGLVAESLGLRPKELTRGTQNVN